MKFLLGGGASKYTHTHPPHEKCFLATKWGGGGGRISYFPGLLSPKISGDLGQCGRSRGSSGKLTGELSGVQWVFYGAFIGIQ